MLFLFSYVDLTNFLVFLQTPRVVSLLSESYNPHVRYGAAIAVGVSCAGTGLSEAISLLEPLTSDVVDFVRQGALIAMAMVLVQTNESREPRVGSFRYVVPGTLQWLYFIKVQILKANIPTAHQIVFRMLVYTFRL
jgi:hypothetical protein